MKKLLFLFILTIVFQRIVISQKFDMVNNETFVNSQKDAAIITSQGKNGEAIAKYEFIRVDMKDKMDAIGSGELKNSFFGEKIARKEKLFNDLYTYSVPVGPGSPATKVVISKPAIYNAVNKLFKYYKNSTKKGILSLERSTYEYDLVLDIVLSAIYQDSEKFEEDLNKTKNIDAVKAIFQSVALISR